MRRLFYLLSLLCLFFAAMPAWAQEKTATFVFDKSKTTGSSAPYTLSLGSADSVSLSAQVLRSDRWRINNGYSMTLTSSPIYVITKISITQSNGGNMAKESSYTYDFTSGASTLGSVTVSTSDNNWKSNTYSFDIANSTLNNITITANGITNSSTNKNGYVDIANVVVTYESAKSTKTTTIASTKTTSTASGTVWDFSDGSSQAWGTTLIDVKTLTSEWNQSATNEFRPTTILSSPTEYDLDIVRGLQFTIPSFGGLCLDYAHTQIWMTTNGTITIPGLTAGQYVRITKAGNVSDFSAPDGTEAVDGNVFKVNTSGDKTFIVPRGGVWIKKIEILGSEPTYTYNFPIGDLDIAHNVNQAQGMDRTVGGFSFTFNGGDAAKSFHDNTPYIVLRYRNGQGGSLTIKPTDSSVKITNIEYTTLSNGEGISNNNTSITNADGAETLLYTNNDEKSTGIWISGIQITTNKRVAFTQVTPTLAFNKSELTLNEGMTGDNVITTTPSSLLVSYSSSNENIATYDGQNVTAGSTAGTATITATYTPTNSSLFKAATATFTVNVANVIPNETNNSRNLRIASLDYYNGASGERLDRTTRGFDIDINTSKAKYSKNDGAITFNGYTYDATKPLMTVSIDKNVTTGAKIKYAVLTLSGDDKDVLMSAGSSPEVTNTEDILTIAGKDIAGTPVGGSYYNVLKVNSDDATSFNVYGLADGSAFSIKSIYVEWTDGETIADNPASTNLTTTTTVLIAPNASTTVSMKKLDSTPDALDYGQFSASIASSDVATCKVNNDGTININTTDGATAGQETSITVTYTPSDAKYFNSTSVTVPIRVVNPISTTTVWQFNADPKYGNNNGIGHGQTFDTTNWSKNGDEYYNKHDLTGDDGSELFIGTDPTTLQNTAGITFNSTNSDKVRVYPDKYLLVDDEVTMRIKNVAGDPTANKGKGKSYKLLITGQTANPNIAAGFTGLQNASQSKVQALQISKNEQTFILDVNNKQNCADIVFKPTEWMKIYRIELTTVATQPKISFTADKDTIDMNGSDKTVKLTATISNNVSGKLEILTKDTAQATITGDPVTVTSSPATATATATAAHGGWAIFVAKFTPADGATDYTYNYATVNVYINDPRIYAVTNGQQIECGDKVTSVDGITMYFGGWNKEKQGDWGKADNNKRGNNSNYKGDYWDKGGAEGTLTSYPGYDYCFSANDDASDETDYKYNNGYETGANASTNKEGTSTAVWYQGAPNNPYTMPVFGGFIKFCPEKDGQLTVYIHQNGAICQDNGTNGTKNNFNPFKVHMRSYYIADETGRLYSPNEDHVTAECIGKVDDVWFGAKGSGILNSFGHADEFNEEDLEEQFGSNDYDEETSRFQPAYDFFYKNIGADPSNTGKYNDKNGNQMVYYVNHGFVTMNECVSKYSLPVKAGKTYFFFTNKTKFGFYGFEFQPDANVAEQTITLPSESSEDAFTIEGFDNTKYHKVSMAQPKTLSGKWNAVCLPFSLNEEQTKEAFGDDVEVLDWDHVDSDHNNKMIFYKHYYQMIVAGRPYLVWSSKTKMDIPDSYVSFPVDDNGNLITEPQNVTADGYCWTGTYNRQYLPQYAYALGKDEKGASQFKQIMKPSTNHIAGYRAYLYGTNAETQAAKQIVFDYGGVQETPTGIEDVEAELFNDPQTSGRVFNLNGQLVSRNGLNGLAKGVYIMNGKKYIVK